MAERLADKYEEAKEKQEDIMSRSGGCTLFSALPYLGTNSVTKESGSADLPVSTEEVDSSPSLESQRNFS